MQLPYVEYSEFSDVQYINRGQFGMVHKAKYKETWYAIKIQSIESKRDETNPKFKGYETNLRMAELNHENIVKVVFTTRTKTDPMSLVLVDCLVLEYADYCLYDVLHKYMHLNYSPELGMLWLLQIARALDYLHSRPSPILHRDMKSPNILLFGDGRTLKITDFGHATDIHTVMTSCAGTIKWMAPEIITSKSYNETCDIYSFSIILWEILTREEPYSGEKFRHMMLPQFMMEIIKQDIRPDSITDAPPVLIDIMVKCWNKDYLARPSAASLVTTFEKLCHMGKLVKPLQTGTGEHLKQTIIPKSLMPFVDKSEMSSHDKCFKRQSVPELMSSPNLLPLEPDSSAPSKGILNRHMSFIKSYHQTNANLRRLLGEEVEVDRRLLQEQETMKQTEGVRERLDEINKIIIDREAKRNELWYKLNINNINKRRF